SCVAAAFSRRGRFDMLLQVMPPTLSAKLENPEWKEILRRSLDALAEGMRLEAERKIEDLTYLETQHLVQELMSLKEPDQIYSAISNAWASCTLEKPHDIGRDGTPGANWRTVCEREADEFGRFPPLRM